MTSDPRTVGLINELQGWVTQPLLEINIETKPSANHRPRLGRGNRVFYAADYQEFHSACQQQIHVAWTETARPEGPFQGPLGVIIETRRTLPKSTKLPAPRGDADNYAKAPLDAATKVGIWGDDGQIVYLGSIKRWCRQGEPEGVRMLIGVLKDIN